MLASTLTTYVSVFFITGRSCFGMNESKRSLGSTFSTSYFYSTCKAYSGRSSTIRKEKISSFWERRDPKEQKDVCRVRKCSSLPGGGPRSALTWFTSQRCDEKSRPSWKSTMWSSRVLSHDRNSVSSSFPATQICSSIWKSLFFNHRHGSKMRNRLGGINLEQITVRRDWDRIALIWEYLWDAEGWIGKRWCI